MRLGCEVGLCSMVWDQTFTWESWGSWLFPGMLWNTPFLRFNNSNRELCFGQQSRKVFCYSLTLMIMMVRAYLTLKQATVKIRQINLLLIRVN